MIVSGTVGLLCASQMLSWGISFYLIGVFGDSIQQDLGWSNTAVYGGFSFALCVMGLISPTASHLIARYGGRPVMTAGSLLTALGCFGIAVSHNLYVYYASWLCLGIAMRLTLYDAAFSVLSSEVWSVARRGMAQITLVGGLSCSVFWLLGHTISETAGWRASIGMYSLFAIIASVLHSFLPKHTATKCAKDNPFSGLNLISNRSDFVASSIAFAITTAIINGISTGLAAHLIGILDDLELGESVLWIAILIGVGQCLGRCWDAIAGTYQHPMRIAVLFSLAMLLAFLVALIGHGSAFLCALFVLVYGAS
ncbi:MAG: MFS transporter, partial [Methylotenera sp.]